MSLSMQSCTTSNNDILYILEINANFKIFAIFALKRFCRYHERATNIYVMIAAHFLHVGTTTNLSSIGYYMLFSYITSNYKI